jgi:hypothetical protein
MRLKLSAAMEATLNYISTYNCNSVRALLMQNFPNLMVIRRKRLRDEKLVSLSILDKR